MKCRRIAIAEGWLYFLIPFFTPIAAFLASEAPLTWRTGAAVVLGGLVGGLTSLKAFFSQALSPRQISPTAETAIANFDHAINTAP